jgi:acyl-CoA dehydrogenase
VAWEFETDPEFQAELDWMKRFVDEEVAPLEYVLGNHYDLKQPNYDRLVRPLQQKVRERRLWACHLGPELGGPGYGQLKLALMNEILGRSRFAPIVFGTQAPDTGNAEILAHFGSKEHKERYLKPLLETEIVSCYSMTEPQGGADPMVFQTRAELDGDEWVINGEKWFSSNAQVASFFITMAVTDREAPANERFSMFIIPAETAGLEIVREVTVGLRSSHVHPYVRYNNVRIPKGNLLGERGKGFVVAQIRLGGGRIHHAMRTVGAVQLAFDMMCERALSRTTKGSLLADKQMVQEKIADSWIEIEQFRLFVLRCAWKIDRYQDYTKVLVDIAAVKAAMPKVYHDVVARTIQVHGSLGVSHEMPLTDLMLESLHMGLVDGPTEVHKITVAKRVLRQHRGTADLFPTRHKLRLAAEARAKYADILEGELANL